MTSEIEAFLDWCVQEKIEMDFNTNDTIHQRQRKANLLTSFISWQNVEAWEPEEGLLAAMVRAMGMDWTVGSHQNRAREALRGLRREGWGLIRINIEGKPIMRRDGA